LENQTYLQLLKNAFHFLFENYSYSIVHHVAEDPFWNAQTYLQSNDFIIQIVNDWCQISLDLKPYNPSKPLKKQLNDFNDFILILKLLEVPEEKELTLLYEKILSEMFCEDSEWCNVIEKERGVIQMNVLANIFEKYYEQIREIFGKEKKAITKTKLALLQKRSVTEL